MPVFYRSRLLRKAVIALPQGNRLRREGIFTIIAWSYREFNRTGRIPHVIISPDVECEQTGALIDTAGTFHGYDGLDAVIDELHEAFDPIRFELLSAIEISRNRILLLIRISARGKGSGMNIDRTVGHMYDINDNCATRFVVFWEEADALKAAGIRTEAAGPDIPATSPG